MKASVRIFVAIMFCACIFSLAVHAEDAEITGTCTISVSDGTSSSRLTDGSESTGITIPAGESITISSEHDIASLYITFLDKSRAWRISDETGNTSDCGENGFLHEYVSLGRKLGGKSNRVTLTFPDGAKLSRVCVFPSEDTPSWVQKWNGFCDRADLMLFTTHADDEQLFFLGVLPYYAGERGYRVQIVYMVNHNDTVTRPHELLNGLWTVGVKNYPVIGEFPDLYSESLAGAERGFAARGYTHDDFVRYQVENIRRFKPQVVIGHDVNGEYGHGAHILNSATLREALEISNDASKYPDSAEKYGVWDVPKTYLHLWDENKVVMNWDIPLDTFGGKTAYEVSCDGFMCHKSQHWTWFYRWIFGRNGKNKCAADIKSYSPCLYGLYRTTVGYDTESNDFFENIVPYDEQERLAEEERIREREERAAEESRAAESRAAESRKPGNEKNAVSEQNRRHGQFIFICAASLAVIVAAANIIATARKNSRRGRG